MLVRNSHIIAIVFLTVFNLSISYAQKHIGILGGASKGTFLNFAKYENYDATYHMKNGASFSSFYETKIDSINNFRIELQYKFQKTDLEIKYNEGHASFYKKLNYSLQQLNLNLIYSIGLLDKNSLKMFFSLGPTLAYSINTKAQGNGSDFVYQTQIDTSGNQIQILTSCNWEKSENKSKDITQFNFGFDAGLDFMIPINNKLDFIIQNKYNIFLTNITTIDKLKYTSLFTGYINIGIRYNLSN